jgi:ACS family hexuronate transporter-like MFS transporter
MENWALREGPSIVKCVVRRSFFVSPQWLAMGVFWLSFSLNFLDRQLLAAVAPALKLEFHLSNTEYGQLVSGFYLVYAIATPLGGLLIDRVLLRAGAAIAITIWSLAGAATAMTRSFFGLLVCRMGLGLGESAGIPLLGKATVTYLDPAEMGLAGGFGAISISLGSIAAPLVVAALTPRFGWRSVFVLSGLLGLLWVPLWLFVSRRVPPRVEIKAQPSTPARYLLRDRRLWAVALAYCLVYSLYMLWANWTTIYLVQERHFTQLEANTRYAWFPPAFAVLGGFLGGALAFALIRRGMGGLAARMRVCWFTAPLLLVGASVPFLPSATLAAAAIGVTFLACQSILSNLFLIPLDMLGASPAGFTSSLLAFVAASTQVLVSPAIGVAADRIGFTVLCVVVALLPLFGLAILRTALRATLAGPLPPHAR